MRSRAALVGWVVAGVAVLIVALIVSAPGSSATHLDPASAAPGGTKALVELTRASGADVTVSAQMPDRSTAVALLLTDTTSPVQSDQLDRWVQAGGVLVVADPRSSFVPTPRRAPSIFGLGATTVPRGECSIAALGGVDQVAPGSGSVRYEVPEGSSSCLAESSGAFVVDAPEGAGHVVAVGGADVFTNQQLGSDDNAVLAVGLLAPRPGTELRVLWGMRAGTSRPSLTSLISTGVRLGLWELVAAFVLYALWRGRRLGRPVPEPQPVQIGGSELVAAVGRLLERSHDPDRAARLLRADLRRQLGDRLGLGPHASAAVVAEVAAVRTGVERDEVARAVTDLPVRTEAELLDLAHDIDRIRTEVLHGTH